MKIRFLMTIPTEFGSFHSGQVIDIDKPTPEMQAWLKPTADGIRRAEVVREDRSVTSEVAVTATGARRGRPRRDEDVDPCPTSA